MRFSRFITALSFIWIFLCGFGQMPAQNFHPATRMDSFPRADGEQPEWTTKLYQSEKTGMIYTVGQTDSLLFVGLEIHDPTVRDQILLTGMTLYILPKGKKKLRKGITYPLGLPEDDRTNHPDVLREQRAELPKQLRFMASLGLELVNFYGDNEKTWGSQDNKAGIRTAINISPLGVLIYEAVIPLEFVLTAPEETYYPEAKNYFDIRIETGSLGRPEIRGDMGVGISSTPNPRQVTPAGSYDRGIQGILEEYRAFTIPAKDAILKVKLTRP